MCLSYRTVVTLVTILHKLGPASFLFYLTPLQSTYHIDPLFITLGRLSPQKASRLVRRKKASCQKSPSLECRCTHMHQVGCVETPRPTWSEAESATIPLITPVKPARPRPPPWSRRHETGPLPSQRFTLLAFACLPSIYTFELCPSILTSFY
jgi:hypothetical protein